MPHAAVSCSTLRRAATLALLLLGSSGHARAADLPPPRPLDRAARAAVLDSLGAQLMRNYVEADTARLIVDRLKARQRAGAYDTLTSPRHFAEVVTSDLRGINGDLHLSLRWDPQGAGGGGGSGPTIVRRVGPGPDGAGPGAGGASGGAPSGGASAGSGPVIVMGPPRPGGPGGGPGGAPPSAGDSLAIAHSPWARNMVRSNFGLTRAEVLPGNVGYLEITGFMEGPGSDEAVVAALRFLEHTDAMIVDLRRNHGGSGHMSDLMLSHFLPATPVATVRVKSRSSGSFEMQSFAEVPGPRRPDVPLYVLISRETGSAAEAFSFVLHNLKRATLVGDRTAGAGHMVGQFDLPDGFVAGVSITRVSDPRTGLEWERVGVQPDVHVDPAQALTVAHVAAVRGLAAAAQGDDTRQRGLEMQAEWLEAKDRATPVAAARLNAIAGSYEGDRVVTVRNGRLYYAMGTFMPQELVPLSGDRFAMAGDARFVFAAGSPAPNLTIERADGSRSVCARIRSGD